VLSTPKNNPSVTKTFQYSKAGPLRIALGIRNEGARLKLHLRSPDGKEFSWEGSATVVLERLVLQFPTRAAFCKAAGISRDMLSHVLAGRKDLSLESLSKALERVGYRLNFVQTARPKRTG
jgi:hypothetical protein